MSELINIYPNDNMSFNIDNLSETNTEDFVEFDLVLKKEDEVIEEKSLTLNIEPNHNYWLFLEPSEDLPGGEYIYNLSAKTTKALEGVKKGVVLAQAQKVFTIYHDKEEEERLDRKLVVEETPSDVNFVGEDCLLSFSKELGGLVSYQYKGVEYLSSKPTVTFWRPLTDTDYHLGLQYNYAPFIAATVGQQLLPEKYWYEELEHEYRLTFVYRYPLPSYLEMAVIYTVYPDATVKVEATYPGLATVDVMPAFGIDFKLSKELDQIRFYGYGPDENYIDTTEGLNLDVYETTVRKNLKKKDRPQETGNRTGVRWAEVYNGKTGLGLKFTADKKPFEFSALPLDTLEIESAQTQTQLPKSFPNTNVRIASNVSGIGDGENIAPWAIVDAGEMHELSFFISPVEVKLKTKSTSKPNTSSKSNTSTKSNTSSSKKTKKEATKK